MSVFAYSTNEEEYHELGEFGSYAAAFEEAANLLALQPGDSVWVGQKAEVDLNRLAGDLVDGMLEDISEHAYEEYGEIAEDWPSLEDSELNELDEQMRDVVVSFLRKHCPPKFWGIAESKKFTI